MGRHRLLLLLQLDLLVVVSTLLTLLLAEDGCAIKGIVAEHAPTAGRDDVEPDMNFISML